MDYLYSLMKFFNHVLKTCIFLLFVLAFSINGYTQKQVLSENNHQVLPVSLTSFTLQSDEQNKIIAKWSTSNEANNKQFDVLISTDGSNFSKYATVKGKGNSNEPTNYELVIDLKSKIITGSLFLSFLLISSVRNRKLRMGILALFAFTIISCSKKKWEELTEIKHYYVQLRQVDNNGKNTMYDIKVITIEVPKMITIEVPKK